MESSKNRKITLIAVAAIVIIMAGYFYWDLKGSPSVESPVVSQDSNASTTSFTQGGVTVQLPAGSTIEQVGPEQGKVPQSIPDLKRPLRFSGVFANDMQAQSIMTKKILDLEASLGKDPASLDNWILLGVDRKILGDYEGARDAWNYAGLLSPTNVVSFNNLGDLYENELRNYSLSEQSYFRAIKNDPAYVPSYENLSNLYRYYYKKDTSSAADILKQGLSVSPDNVDLMAAIARYYAATGDKKDAATYYQQAIARAKSLGNAQLEASLRAESAQ